MHLQSPYSTSYVSAFLSFHDNSDFMYQGLTLHFVPLEWINSLCIHGSRYFKWPLSLYQCMSSNFSTNCMKTAAGCCWKGIWHQRWTLLLEWRIFKCIWTSVYSLFVNVHGDLSFNGRRNVTFMWVKWSFWNEHSIGICSSYSFSGSWRSFSRTVQRGHYRWWEVVGCYLQFSQTRLIHPGWSVIRKSI